MGDVIQHDFSDDKKSGYFVEGRLVKGLYVDGFGVEVDDDKVFFGKSEHLNGGLMMENNLSKKDMNRFCVMWLALFDPDVLKYDE